MSLDDIIKKKKIGTFRGNRTNVTVKPKKLSSGGAAQRFSPKKTTHKPIQDARNKIIQRNRAKIHDARDKLAQIAKRSGDARLKLLRKKKVEHVPAIGKRNTVSAMPALFTKRMPPHLPTKRMHRPMDMEVDVEMSYASTAPLRRTVKNDIAYGGTSAMPPLPTFKYMETQQRSENLWESDPFDCYEVPVARPYDVSEPRHLSRSIRTVAHMDSVPSKGILRPATNGSSLSYERPLPPPAPYPVRSSALADPRRRYAAIEDSSQLSQEMRNRLQRTPDVTQSAGMFSNPYALGSRDPTQTAPNQGYRIVVSNLHSSVSQSDIKELFEDIGELVDARLVRVGVAEVIFEKLKDAETAVDTYHNRQLDGQPMKCMLVNPRASNRPTAPAIKTTRR